MKRRKGKSACPVTFYVLRFMAPCSWRRLRPRARRRDGHAGATPVRRRLPRGAVPIILRRCSPPCCVNDAGVEQCRRRPQRLGAGADLPAPGAGRAERDGARACRATGGRRDRPAPAVPDARAVRGEKPGAVHRDPHAQERPSAATCGRIERATRDLDAFTAGKDLAGVGQHRCRRVAGVSGAAVP